MIAARPVLRCGYRANYDPRLAAAIQKLAKIGLQEITQASDAESARAILGAIALAKGARTHARFLLKYSEDELLELEAYWSDHS